MSEKVLNLSDNRIYENLLAYLAKQNDITVSERASTGETVVIGDDWNDKKQVLGDFIETYGTLKSVIVGFPDEWYLCDNCNKSCHREDDHVMTSHGDYWCEECVEEFKEAIIEDTMNCEDRAWNQFLNNDWLTEAGFKICKNCEDKQSGMHPGMNDTPQGVIRDFCEDNELKHIQDEYDYIFVIEGSNPFMVNYSMWVREI